MWRVEGSWDAQTYRTTTDPRFREERASGGLSVGNWLTPHLRYELNGGLDVWDGTRRAVAAGGGLEQRWFGDRVSLTGAITHWNGLKDTPSFDATSLVGSIRSSTNPLGWVMASTARMEAATEQAPLALWPGAGDGRTRPGLLRAHGLVHDGIIDDSVFGRCVAVVNVELQRWFQGPMLVRYAAAAFMDAAHADRRLTAEGKPLQVDVGLGLRMRVPGTESGLRLDVAHGTRDGTNRISVGWTP